MCEVTSHSRIEPKHYIYWNTVYVAQTLLSLNNKCKNNLDYNEIQVFFYPLPFGFNDAVLPEYSGSAKKIIVQETLESSLFICGIPIITY